MCTLTLSWAVLKRPIRRMQLRMGSLLSSSMLWVQMGGRHWRWVAKMARFIMVKSSLSKILDTSGSCPLTTRKRAMSRHRRDDIIQSKHKNQLTLKVIRRVSSQSAPSQSEQCPWQYNKDAMSQLNSPFQQSPSPSKNLGKELYMIIDFLSF